MRHVRPEGRVGHERAHGVPGLSAVGDLGQGACGQQAVGGRRRGAHHGSAAGQDLNDAARKHGGAVHHGADVEEDGVGAVGAEHLGVGEAAAHVRVPGSRELVGVVAAEVPGEDVQPVGQACRDVVGAAQDDLHLLAPLGVLVSEIGAGEGDIPQGRGTPRLVQQADRVVDRGLGGEGQDPDAVMSQVAPVVLHHRLIGGEDPVEEAGGLDGLVVVGGILLVPEDRRHSSVPQCGDHVPQVARGSLGADDLEAPGVVVAVPGGLHEEQVDGGLLDLLAPAGGGQGHRAPLVAQGERRELVGDHPDGHVVTGPGLLR